MKIVPGKKYTYDQIRAMQNDPELKGLQMKGYVLRQDLDGTVQFVHYSQASGPENKGPGTVATADVDWDLEPISKRTPHDRVDSLMVRLLMHQKETGQAALTEEQVTEVLGEAWKQGRTEITSDVIRAVATRMLERAERLAK